MIENVLFGFPILFWIFDGDSGLVGKLYRVSWWAPKAAYIDAIVVFCLFYANQTRMCQQKKYETTCEHATTNLKPNQLLIYS